MSRGKPSSGQLDLGMGLLNAVDAESLMQAENGLDTRNYGGLDGIPEAKRLMAGIMEVRPDQVTVCGNSSLNAMYDTVARAIAHGVIWASTPWCKLDKVKFLCPVPGYDRHFAVTEHFGVEMVNVPMTAEGPDMDMVERSGKQRMMPSRESGVYRSTPIHRASLYSDETVRRMAALKPAAEDFRIFWDNAYASTSSL